MEGLKSLLASKKKALKTESNPNASRYTKRAELEAKELKRRREEEAEDMKRKEKLRKQRGGAAPGAGTTPDDANRAGEHARAARDAGQGVRPNPAPRAHSRFFARSSCAPGTSR